MSLFPPSIRLASTYNLRLKCGSLLETSRTCRAASVYVAATDCSDASTLCEEIDRKQSNIVPYLANNEISVQLRIIMGVSPGFMVGICGTKLQKRVLASYYKKESVICYEGLAEKNITLFKCGLCCFSIIAQA